MPHFSTQTPNLMFTLACLSCSDCPHAGVAASSSLQSAFCDEAWFRYLLDDIFFSFGRPGLSPHLHSGEDVCPYILLTLMLVFVVTTEWKMVL
ncbi:hypothetical protein NPIL_66201 [Nephila pilipes]|uniref:Uncharacterized protein n=1 Tax=Nephila pilipes TaxID=299642 RepID=A0A8X6TG04_NEPPI|nr:hypothetical protein NPIL_66201 [Nephila pilipes]